MARIITKGLIGQEDINIGTSTFTRVTSVGGTQTLHQVPLVSLLGTNTWGGVQTFPAGVLVSASPTITGTDTGAETLSNKTLSTSTLNSPVINGTPSGTGVPTVTLKKGSGSGNYVTASNSYVDVDAANLALTVTIPTGWKLLISASGVAFISTAQASIFVALFDSATLVERQIQPKDTTDAIGFALDWAITGDGASHTVKMQFKTSNVSDSANVYNSSATLTPTMTFLLTPSN